MNGRQFGLIICILVWFIDSYEMAGILFDRVPTISRVLQGWRDGPGSNTGVWVTVFVILSIVNLFGAWLFHHLLFEARSGL